MKYEVQAAKYSTRRTFYKVLEIEAENTDLARTIAQTLLRSGYTVTNIIAIKTEGEL